MGPRATDDCIVPAIRKSIRFRSAWRAALLLSSAVEPFLGEKRSSRPGRSRDCFARKGITPRPQWHDRIRFGPRDPVAIGLPRMEG
jgi:hypothetical protein